MRQLIAIAYSDPLHAEETRLKLLKMQQEYLLELEDIVIAVKREDGKVKLQQAVNMTAAGAIQGGFLGALIGLLFLNPLLGLAIGAASGAVGGALTDVGIDDEMMTQLAESLQPGSAVLFALMHDMTVDRVIDELAGAGGMVLKTSLKHDDENALRQALAAGQATP